LAHLLWREPFLDDRFNFRGVFENLSSSGGQTVCDEHAKHKNRSLAPTKASKGRGIGPSEYGDKTMRQVTARFRGGKRGNAGGGIGVSRSAPATGQTTGWPCWFTMLTKGGFAGVRQKNALPRGNRSGRKGAGGLLDGGIRRM